MMLTWSRLLLVPQEVARLSVTTFLKTCRRALTRLLVKQCSRSYAPQVSACYSRWRCATLRHGTPKVSPWCHLRAVNFPAMY